MYQRGGVKWEKWKRLYDWIFKGLRVQLEGLGPEGTFLLQIAVILFGVWDFSNSKKRTCKKDPSLGSPYSENHPFHTFRTNSHEIEIQSVGRASTKFLKV